MRYSITNTTIEQIQAVGGTDIKVASSIGVIFAELTDVQVSQLRSRGCIVTPVQKTQAVISPPVPVAALPTYSPQDLSALMGFEQIRSRFTPPLYGENYNLAIIGSGIRETHEKINGRVVYSKNFTDSVMGDTFNHDTGVASIAIAIAPKVNILNLKVLNEKGEGTTEQVVLAIDECISMVSSGHQYAPYVINMSLGTPDNGDPNEPMRVACRTATDKGIYVVAAAGNSGPAPGTILSPACERYVFATGSVKYLPNQNSFVVSEFSSRGPTLEGIIKPDGVMFGEDIIVASSESDTATIAKTGTSFATPFSSGTAILYFEGSYKLAVYQGKALVIPWGQVKNPTSIQELIDRWLPVICIKPAGITQTKDDSYGCGLPFAPLMLEAAGLRPAMDISSMAMPILAICLLGMVVRIIK